MKFATVKKWLALLLAACMVMALAACGKTADDTGTTGGDTGDTGDTGSSAAKIAVVFASSGLGDKSFNDALFNGMKDAESTMASSGYIPSPRMTPSMRGSSPATPTAATATSSSVWAAARAPVWRTWLPTIPSRSS